MNEIARRSHTEECDFSITGQHTSGKPIRASIIIPSYNAVRTLPRAIRSACTQTISDIEIIVVDDASDDGSWGVIAEWIGQDPRICGMHHKRNTGKSIAMNHATAIARGQWLAVLDADDWYHPERLSALISIGEQRNVDMVADNQFLYDMVARVIVGSAWNIGRTEWPLTLDNFLTGSDPYDAFNFGMLKPIVKMDFVRASGLDYDERARHGQDFLYLLQFFMQRGKGIVCDMPYYFYNQPFGAVSRVWSHAARQRYDFQTSFEINRSYVARAEKLMTSRQLRLFKRRVEKLLTLERYYSAKDFFHNVRLGEAMAQCFSRPQMLGYAMRRLFARCFGVRDGRAAARIAARSALYRKRGPCAREDTRVEPGRGELSHAAANDKPAGGGLA